MAKRRERAIEDIGSSARFDHVMSACQGYGETPEFGAHRVAVLRCDHKRCADPQCTVHAETGNRIRHLEPPTGKDRLHDLKTVCDLFDAIEDGGFVHARFGRARQSQHDLGLDLRFA